MSVRAPGKVLLSGPYVVLDGAPATVLAIARYAEADALVREVPKAAEVLEAYAGKAAPRLDLSNLTVGDRKLGLGSSAAGLVAALAADAYEAGQELHDGAFRRELFERAFALHRRVQGGGSGFDVAAAVWGGFFRYELTAPGKARVTNLLWPEGLVIELFAAPTSARTSDFVARVKAFREGHASQAMPMFAALRQAALRASVAFGEGKVREILESLTAQREILAAIGDAADVPIVLPSVQRLAHLASTEASVLLPSGAGGGDVCVRLGIERATPTFLDAARAEGFVKLSLAHDTFGVHASPDSEG